MTRMATGLPTAEHNGLEPIIGDLIDHPHRPRLAVVVLDCPRTTLDNDTESAEATVRIRRIEVIDGEDSTEATNLLRRAYERRTGQTVLPLDLEEELRGLWDEE